MENIEKLLEKLINLSSIKPEVIKDPDLDRPSDVTLLLGDCSRETMFRNGMAMVFMICTFPIKDKSLFQNLLIAF